MEAQERESLAQEQHANVITGDEAMFTSDGKLSAKAITKLGPATALTVLWIAAVTGVNAAAMSIQSTSAASAHARSTLEVQALILRDCHDIDYGRVDGFEGMLSDFVCSS